MVWVDRVVEEIQKRFADKIAKGHSLVIRDEKTLSGPVHVGSLRGFVIHGLIHQVLQEKGIKSVYQYELNDVDPMDALPPVHAEEFQQHLGKPLYAVPSPEAGKAQNYPQYYGNEFKAVLDKLQFDCQLYYLKPQYEGEKCKEFNECIELALDHAEEIRAIYAEVSGGKKPMDWLPVSVICENCGKIGTTKAVAWDRKRGMVQYRCEPAMVTWATGCGHGTREKVEVSPFNEPGELRAKLPWKVEWAAKWKVFEVDIEGAGKDHSAAGGSRAIAARISEEVFHYSNPFDIPYEFFNIGGKKMSASKGLGATAKMMGGLLPPKILKLLMIRKQPNQPIDFNPEETTIPELFDEYDRLADHYFGKHPKPDPDFQRTFALTQVPSGTTPENRWRLRFSTVVFLDQMSHLDTGVEAAKLKGASLTVPEVQDLEERQWCALRWRMSAFIPQRYKFEVDMVGDTSQVHLINDGRGLTEEQRRAFAVLSDVLEKVEWNGQAIHEAIHKVKEDHDIAPKLLFPVLYRIFLYREDGPQMGWFLSTLDRKNVISSLNVISKP